MYTDIVNRLNEVASNIETALGRRIEKLTVGEMGKAMSYSLLGGGKRIRAFLTVEFCKMFGGTEQDAEAYACAVEMVHAYSLIHDDLPCMDDDDMRRGKPSCHKAFGETIALLAGDALLTFAFETASEGNHNSTLAVNTLAKGAGALGMCRGQEIDLSCECNSYEELEVLHNLKTGALINTAATLGYFASGAKITDENLESIKKYSLAVGLAFQIIDDLLDVRSSEAELGKPIGSDEKNGKKTVLSYMSEQEADEMANNLSVVASKVFADMDNSDVICKLPMFLLGRTK